MSAGTNKTLHWILLLAGIWLIIAPFLGAGLTITGGALWSNVIVGLIVGLIALSELFGGGSSKGGV